MKLKTLLVNVPAERITERHYDEPDTPRIALAYLVSFMRHSGKECDVIDGKFERLKSDDILNLIDEKKPDIVGFTAMTTEITDVARLAFKVKRNHPDIVTIVGGPHSTALPSETLREFPAFDIACFGEGEETLSELVMALGAKKPLNGIKGIAFRNDQNAIKRNTPRPFITNLDAVPPPAWELFPAAKKYSILGSRGCPFRCNFCMRVLGERIRFRDADLVLKEMLDVYERYKPSLFEFYDETFGIDKEKTERLLDGIVKNRLHEKIKWHIQTRVDVVNEALLSRMKNAGCEWVGFGIESGNENILRLTNKNITKEKIKKAVNMAKKAKLQTGSFFILGHPNETKNTIDDTVKFALELNTTTVSFGIMTPYPGTEIAGMAVKGEGGYKLLSKNWALYNKQTGDVLELKNLSASDLQGYQLKAYMKFYLYKPSMSKIKSLLSFVDLGSILSMLLKRIFRIKAR